MSSGDAKAGVLRVNGFSPGNSFDQGAGTYSLWPAPDECVGSHQQRAARFHGRRPQLDRAEGDVSLRGNIARGQSLTIAAQDLCGLFRPPTRALLPASSTPVTLRSLRSAPAAAQEAPSLELSGTLTNTGTIETRLGHGTVEYGRVPGRKHHKQGQIDVGTTTSYNNGNSQSNALTLKNQGRINLSDGAILDVPEFTVLPWSSTRAGRSSTAGRPKPATYNSAPATLSTKDAARLLRWGRIRLSRP